jgi:hypothetical protein
VVELRAELEQIDQQIAFKQAEEARLRGVSSAHQERVDRAPARESEMAELMRDYTTLQTMYSALLAKKEESRIAANLERRQIGEQFKLLDPARMAERPFSPNRPFIVAAGMGAGLALGVLLIALGVYRDRSFKTDNDVTVALALPVLAVVPRMRSDRERRRARRRQWAANLGMATVVMACMAVVGYSFLRP